MKKLNIVLILIAFNLLTGCCNHHSVWEMQTDGKVVESGAVDIYDDNHEIPWPLDLDPEFTGVYRTYYENGELLGECHFTKGKPSGKWRFYGTNGKVYTEFVFDGDKGTANYWDDNGKQFFSETLDSDKEVKKKKDK